VILLIGVHIGSQSVEAQSAAQIMGYSATFAPGGNMHFSVILTNGDVYDAEWDELENPRYIGNYFGGPSV